MKRGRGRPKKKLSERKAPVGLRLDPLLWQAVVKTSRRYKMSLARFVERALTTELERWI